MLSGFANKLYPFLSPTCLLQVYYNLETPCFHRYHQLCSHTFRHYRAMSGSRAEPSSVYAVMLILHENISLFTQIGPDVLFSLAKGPKLPCSALFFLISLSLFSYPSSDAYFLLLLLVPGFSSADRQIPSEPNQSRTQVCRSLLL